MPNRQYTQTEDGGFIVESRARANEQSVEIYDKSTGNIVDALDDVTDLRDARDVADPGERILVYPGNYTTKNLLRDGIDWEFMDGAIVSTVPDVTGAIFGNTGVHSVGGQITSNVYGQGTFEFAEGTVGSGFAIVNTLEPNSEIYVEAKEFRAVGDSYGSTFTYIFHGAGQLEVNVDRVYHNPGSVSGFPRFLDNTSSGLSDPSESEGSRCTVTVGDMDYSDSSVYLGLYGNDTADDWRGVTDFTIEKLRTSGNNTFGLGFCQTSATDGHIRFSIKDHVEGETSYGFNYFAGAKTVILDEFDLNMADGASFGIGAAVNDPSLYLNDVTVSGTSGDSLIGVSGNSATPTIDLVTNVSVTGGSNSVDSGVTLQGSPLQTL